jgi:SAM-dependent methyltransferase
VSERTCLICGGTDHRVVFREFDVDVLGCRACGHVFSGYDAEVHYDGYWGEEISDPGEFYWDQAHGPMYETFFRRYASAPEGRLLDVGCGLGFFVRKAKQRLPGWEVGGVEISEHAVRYASEELGIPDLRSGLLEDAGFPDDHFDLVTLWDVLEHLRDPEPLLTEALRILKPGGICFMHTPNVQLQVPKAKLKRLLKGMDPEVHYLEAKDHLHLYSPTTARRLLERVGFARTDVVHLPPIQSVSGSKSRGLAVAKNLWTGAARILDTLTLGHVNLDNLFLAAHKAGGP